jgi:hypothetical protein
LLYSNIKDRALSLSDLKYELNQLDCSISKVGLHKRFTPQAVNFIKAVLSSQMAKHLRIENQWLRNRFFHQICIKDSTKFILPDNMERDFPGYRFERAKQPASMMNLQYEYDILSGNWCSLDYTHVTRNDQADSRDTLDRIREKVLYVRDLGYVTLPYLKAIDEKNAYYVNRLPHKTNVYYMEKGELKLVNWCKLHRELDKSGQNKKEIDIYLGKSTLLKTRMVLFRVDKAVYEQRIRNGNSQGKRKKAYTVTKEYKAKAHYSCFITNVPKQVITIDQIKDLYRLRWQIEIIFKAWKSNVRITEYKQMSKERFECQLITKFIWVLLYWRVYQVANLELHKNKILATCSIIKFYIRAKDLTLIFRQLIQYKNGISNWLKTNLFKFAKEILVEPRKGKMHQNQIIMKLNQP